MLYENLKKVLDKLFHQLYFPMGGSEDSIQAIWMEEPNRKLVTICTDAGYTTVLPNGVALNLKTAEQVERLYLKFFTGRGSLDSIMHSFEEKQDMDMTWIPNVIRANMGR